MSLASKISRLDGFIPSINTPNALDCTVEAIVTASAGVFPTDKVVVNW
jgi:hypothetical protein